jgi:HK97 family phage major capsid protein
MRLGPRIVEVRKELDVASIAWGATAYSVAGNAANAASEETFALTTLLRPKELPALAPISNRLLRDAALDPDVDAVIRDDLAEILARSAPTSPSCAAPARRTSRPASATRPA